MDNDILITNIQRFSLHDGPGIRTTVFLKGCGLRCPWCSNPENIELYTQKYVKDGVEGIYGKYMTVDEIVKECLKDKNYYEGKLTDSKLWKITDSSCIESLPGGVTFSGGEALLQMDKLVQVCIQLHRENIHIAVESSLFVSKSLLELALKHIDLFYVDVKILDADSCKEIEKGNIETYLSNLDIVMNSDVPVVIRIPVIGGFTDMDSNRTLVQKLLRKYRNKFLKIELIKEHNLSASKYRSLKMQMHYTGVDDNLMEKYKTELDKTLNIPVEICKI